MTRINILKNSLKKLIFKTFQQTTKNMQNVPICKEYMYTQTKQRVIFLYQGLHMLEKYLNLEGFLEKSLKIKNALKSTGKSNKSLEKYLNSTIFCRS